MNESTGKARLAFEADETHSSLKDTSRGTASGGHFLANAEGDPNLAVLRGSRNVSKAQKIPSGQDPSDRISRINSSNVGVKGSLIAFGRGP